jgi:arylsulfatase A-like enzyme
MRRNGLFQAIAAGVMVGALWGARACCLGATTAEPAHASRPNVIFVLADDLGYGDLGCYGQQKIRTPHIDLLAEEGMRFTQHYSGSPVCAPSRCVLMTGLHPGHAVIRDNRDHGPEGNFPLPAGTNTLPRLLGRQGYATGAFGKWGLGSPDTDGNPLAQGFGRFYGYNCQRLAHNYYPTYLWDDARKVTLHNPAFPAHDKFRPDENPNDPKSYARFQGNQYSPDLIAQQARAFLKANKDRPFFLYWPTTVPHLALQVPDDSLREYEGLWDDPPYTGGRDYLPHFKPRAAYAAMITRMDREIGRMMDLLRDLGLERDTIVVFTSDNGPLFDKYGGTDCEFFNSHGGLRGRKGSLYEGGFRIPCVVRWSGKVRPGSVSDRVTGFEDWMPTLLDLTGLEASTPPKLDGISFAPTLLGGTQAERPFLYREFSDDGGQQSIRVSNWKAIRTNLMPRGKLKSGAAGVVVKTELYDLSHDPAESHDLAAGHPELLAKLEPLMRQQHVPSKDFPIPALDR